MVACSEYIDDKSDLRMMLKADNSDEYLQTMLGQ
jgi:hypothetical protein